MRIFTLLLIISNLYAYAQDTIFYNNLIGEKVGENIKIKYKSVVTGAKQYSNLKDGKWQALDSQGNILIEAHYTANKRKKSTRKDGLEIYLDPQSGDTILVRNFRKGKLIGQLAKQEAIFVAGNKVFHCYKDFASYTVAEYRYDEKGRIDFTSIWKSSIEDPNNILEDTNYINEEKRRGDPTLLQPASFSTKAQYNYVRNPEFELHPNAHFSIMSFTNHVNSWSIASESPDFYLSKKSALSGRSFVGFRVFSMTKHIEYLQNELKEPLMKDSTYCFSAYLKLSPGSKYATNAFGFLLSHEKQKINTDELLKVQPSKRLNSQVLNYKTQWMKVQCTYTATGGERFLVLGSFQNHNELELIEVPGTVPESYYYMDDVSLVPIANEKNCACNFSDSRVDTTIVVSTPPIDDTPFSILKIGEKLVLDNIHFENDKSTLLPESFTTLSDVLHYLSEHSSVQVEISGHTSSIGGLQHNMLLSDKRAKAVKKFLTINGIEESRIITKGHGPKLPIASNDTSEGQKENRRVEFKILSL